MPRFTGVADVLKYNDRQFVTDFNRLRSFVVRTSNGDFYEILKLDIWRRARVGRINYRLRGDVYLRTRTSMQLL